MKISLTIVVFFAFLQLGMAAKLEVYRFSVNEDDPTALAQNRFDRQRKMCALIKVTAPISGLKFSCNPSITEQSITPGNVYYLYVSPTENALNIDAPDYPRLSYQTPVLLSGRVYEMEIVVDDTPENELKGSIYFKSDPPANIFLNEESIGTTPHFLTSLSPGSYSVRISMEGYRDYFNKNVVVETGKTTDVVVKLNPLPGNTATRTAALQSEMPPKPPLSSKKEKKLNENGWFIGLTIGAVIPNNYTANYYSGSPDNINSFERLFKYPYTSTVYEDISNAIGQNFDTTNIGYSTNMSYNIAPNLGLYGGYIIKKKNRVFLTFDYHRLKTTAPLVLYYDQITPGNKDNYLMCNVSGKEDRYHINATYSREFYAAEAVNWYVMGGVNVNTVVVKEDKVYIPKQNTNDYLEYSIRYVGYYPDGTPVSYGYEEGGTGFGFLAGAGLRLMFGNSFSLDPEVQLFYSKINLYGYNDFKPYVQFNLRINLLTVMRKNEKHTHD